MLLMGPNYVQPCVIDGIRKENADCGHSSILLHLPGSLGTVCDNSHLVRVVCSTASFSLDRYLVTVAAVPLTVTSANVERLASGRIW